MNNKWLFIASAVGVLGAGVSAWYAARHQHALPPVFQPANNPYTHGIYANGIIESDQRTGSNINLYPEVTGTVAQILVHEGQPVKKGDALLALDDSVQRATTAQQLAQAEAAAATLAELKAQPRPETLAVNAAQLTQAQAARKTAKDQYDKLLRAVAINPQSVSRDTLDNAANALKVAAAAEAVAQRQLELTRAGAWSYDIRVQQAQLTALRQAAQASQTLLGKYTLRAPADGTVMSINAALGGLVSTQGTYDSYTQSQTPAVVMSTGQPTLAVRCYIDEILIHRLPAPNHIVAQMTIRGTEVHVPLQFVRVQPYVSPKIELSNQRQERVDLRVLPVLFRFTPPAGTRLYPGQLVDVYVGQK
ncbi:biotin/lipoyl-binding protein [Crenobacter sp. SG2303]|uniref:Biotin/lipoyl-binding protein n=1 Tax=Crenobacter oryzisoli TaxID=3056844 RepID=A0ABT7XQN5_9NEIS|nr:biotin/lipoyl-binding protein [Crenobacter sp. SG2303]MDN0076025.1 biotin/lipoyl-binding protein [Crenobacter sp. SG2303]